MINIVRVTFSALFMFNMKRVVPSRQNESFWKRDLRHARSKKHPDTCVLARRSLVDAPATRLGLRRTGQQYVLCLVWHVSLLLVRSCDSRVSDRCFSPNCFLLSIRTLAKPSARKVGRTRTGRREARQSETPVQFPEYVFQSSSSSCS